MLKPTLGFLFLAVTRCDLTIGVQGLTASIYSDTFTEYLSEALDQTITVQVFNNDSELTAATIGNQLNFTYTGPPLFSCLSLAGVGASSVAEVIQRSYLQPSVPVENLAGAIVVPANSSITTLAQLRGKRILGGQIEQLSTFLSQWEALNADGVNLFRDVRAYFITTNTQAIIADVLAQKADAGFVTGGTIENFTLAGILPGPVRVLNPQSQPGYPYQHSTALYPNSVVASIDPVSFELRKQVAQALYDIQPNSTLTAWGFAPTRDIVTVFRTLEITGQVNPASSQCRNATSLSDQVQCPLGFGRVQDLGSACSMNGIDCPYNYTCICSPCTPIHPRIRIAGLTVAAFAVLTVAFVLAVATALFILIRMVSLYTPAVPFRHMQFDVSKPIGYSTNGPVLLGTHRGQKVAVKKVFPPNRNRCPGLDVFEDLLEAFWILTPTKKDLRRAHVTRDLQHPNVMPLLGISRGPQGGEVWIIMPYMESGTLGDLINQLDESKALAVCLDVARAMAYFHSLNPPVYGKNIKPHHLFLDESFRAVVGISFRPPNTNSVWAPPECSGKSQPWTDKADVWAFSMLMYILVCRKGKYSSPQHERPVIDQNSNTGPTALIQKCWNHDPSARPPFSAIQTELTDIIDHHNRTHRLSLQRPRQMLSGMFPDRVLQLLESGRAVPHQNHDEVTVFFSDIKDFTHISSLLQPSAVAAMLDRLYRFMDDLAQRHHVHKMETIGDGFVAVTNLMQHQPDHAAVMARFALEVMRGASLLPINPARPQGPFLELRIGLNSGPVTAGVVGTLNPRYCLFGATVNIASRMESTGAPCNIHLTRTTSQLIRQQDSTLAARILRRPNLIEVKGQGLMQTYWLS